MQAIGIFVIWAIVWILFGFGVAEVFAEKPDLPNDFIIICEILKIEPFYNCDNKWIFITNNEITIKDPLGQWVLGYGVYDEFIQNWDMSICNFYPGFREMGLQYCEMEWGGIGTYEDDLCYSGRCLTHLQHEIKHLQCDCNWHKDSWPSKRMVITVNAQA